MRVTVTPEQIQSAFDAVKADGSFEESRGLWERGQPPTEMIQAMCLRPEILRGFGAFGHGLYPDGLLERRVKELVIITASAANDCQFCRESHCHLVQITDIVQEPLRAIGEPDRLAPRERLAIAYTHAAMADSNAIPESLMGELHDAFSDPELVELTLLIGYINMLNLFNNCLQVRYNDEYSALALAAAQGPTA
jgi:alkylhydroperoxidase family enzyme